ncbi:MAG: glycosyl hydrolase family 28-related protein [Edaphobacter sp.]
MKCWLLLFCALSMAIPCYGNSYYPLRLDDPAAVYVVPGQSHVHGDGKADDTDALQAAIDKVQETKGEGIVFVAQGHYRISHTIYIWQGVRVIGYGAERPVFVLGDHTPGYQDGISYMVFFAGGRPRKSSGRMIRYRPMPTPVGTVPPVQNIPDANPGTFYSAMSNIDFEVGDGNAGAVAIRFHAAQHAYLAHIDFHMGSGFAGINETANEAEDLHFYGGEYGIMTRKPSPAWQFTLIDSSFEGQRKAGIRENEAGLTLVRDSFKNMPTAVEIDPHYSDQLWIKDARFENISGPAVILSNETSRMTEINFEDIVCQRVPVFAQLRESGRQFAGSGEMYEVKSFSHGLTLPSVGGFGEIKTHYESSPLKGMPPSLPRAIRALPEASTWVNLRSLGVKGDGTTDDTAAIQKAIETHPVLYIPSGRYIVTDTLTLRPDTVLIGLHPSTTQFDIPDSTPGFQGPGAPKPLLLAPQGGSNIVTGIGLFTGGINSRAVGAMWMSGKDSLLDDVRFLGGHGTNLPNGTRMNPYNNTHSADPDIHRRWDAQYPSLWITNGGGGTFANIWTPDTFAQAGLYISDTSTPGWVYELSSEHHVRNEIKLNHVANWELYALQTEEESGESGFASSLEIHNSKNITVANYHGYRVTHMEQPFPYAVRVSGSNDIRFRNVHVDGNSSVGMCEASGICRQAVRSNKVPYDNAIVDQTLHAEVRDREFAWLNVSDDAVPVKSAPRHAPSTIVDRGATVQKLAGGFFSAAGAAVDATGQLYFVDARFQRIYKWNAATKSAIVLRDNPLDPVNLIFDKAGDLIVLSSGGKDLTAYSFRPDTPEDQVTMLSLEPAAEQTGMIAAMPVDYWFNGDFSDTRSATRPYTYTSLNQMFEKGMTTRKTYQFVSPDKSLFIPTDAPIVQGEPSFGTKWAPVLEAYGLVKTVPGKPFYATNEAEQRTYRGEVNADGTMSSLKVFVERGGESLAQDSAGNVYIAAGQIFVYSPAGKLIDTIDVPERPQDILFGGPDGRTLYIFSHASLYSIRTRNSGL